MKYKVLSALLAPLPVDGTPAPAENSEGAPSAENAVIETIYARRSIRRFSPSRLAGNS